MPCSLFLIILVNMTPISRTIAETNLRLNDDAKPSEGAAAGKKTYKLPLPGKDPRTLHILVGEAAFRSGELRAAREAFEKVLELDSQNAQAHYFLGIIEYEAGNMEKAKARFQIAHECLEASQAVDLSTTDNEYAQIEFPEDYEARIYNKDGWYISPKDPDVLHKNVHSLEAGSTYRITLRSKRKYSWIQRGVIGLALAFSFLLAR